MKIFRPLTYMVAAAAMCILCFSGNGQYVYAVYAPTSENDIVEQPDNPLAEKNLAREKIQSSRIKRYVQLYISACLSKQCSENDNFEGTETPCDSLFTGAYDIENDALYEYFLIGLPGNRSP